MSNYTDKCSNINESANIWMHRCNHYGKAAWEMLGYNYEKNEFSDESGCYISVGCGSGKWSIAEYNSIKSSVDNGRNLKSTILLAVNQETDTFCINSFLSLKKMITSLFQAAENFMFFRLNLIICLRMMIRMKL